MKTIKILNEEGILIEKYEVSSGLIAFVKAVLKVADEISRGEKINNEEHGEVGNN